MSADCIFCKIIAGHIPCKKILETSDILVIQDIAPKAPLHYLIMPKRHILDIRALAPSDHEVPSQMLYTAQELAQKLFGTGDFRLVFNNGPDSGQSVFHMHAHFLSGKKMADSSLA